MLRPFAEYLLEFASTAWGPAVLVLHAYLESFILPVAHEFFLVPVCLATPSLSFVFALMSTVASTLGIMTGYAIGGWGGRRILERVIKPSHLAIAEREIHRHDVWAIAIACFTPFPDKVFSILAGSMKLQFKRVVIVAFFSRGARFMLVSFLLFIYGEKAREWILNSIGKIMIGLLLAMILSAFLWNRFVLRTLEKNPETPEKIDEK